MRLNQPVTNNQIHFSESTIIVSRTDAGGRIQFVNDDFIRISGFSREELIGQPHNIVRHPDMPQEAFEDMWRDIKAGKAWCGYVKNRCKNGDYYWVKANATPVVENGTIAGFVSIRTNVEPQLVSYLEDVYRKFREKKADGLAVEHGAIIDTTRKAKIQRKFEQFSTKVKFLGGALCCMLLIVGAVGIFCSDQITESLRTVYEDRTIPAGQLSTISTALHDAPLMLSYVAATQDQNNIAKYMKDVEADLDAIKKNWDAYMATYLTPEEKILAEKFEGLKNTYIKEMMLPAVAMAKEGKKQELMNHILKYDELYDQVAQVEGALEELQMRVAKEEYEKSKVQSRTGLMLIVGSVILALIFSLYVIRNLQKALSGRITQVDGVLNSIASGNLKTKVDIGNDELQNILITISAMQAKLLYGQLEKKELEGQTKAMQEKLANDFEQSVKSIVNLVAAAATELSQTARSMVSTIKDGAQKASEATSAASSTSANVQTVASAAEELSASVREISGQLQKTTSLVNQSSDKAQNADNLANALTAASDKVSSAMEMIANISGQINLLALNATIESARAGEAGKGFAVVASEVKNLASQTDKTVVEIHGVIEEMKGASQAIIKALSDIKGSVGSISEAASSVASAVEEQSATTNEIARSMQTAAAGTQTISNNLQNVSSSSMQAGTASEQMLQASQELSQQAEMLNTQVDDFLRKIRAA